MGHEEAGSSLSLSVDYLVTVDAIKIPVDRHLEL